MSRRAFLPGLTAATAVLVSLIAVAPVASADDDKGGLVSDRSSGTVSERRAVANSALAKVEAIFDGTASAAEKRSATIALRDLRVAREDLTAADQVAAEAFLARPSTDQVLCSATTCVHYATGIATPEYADTVLDTVDDVRARYVAAGYRTPLPDGTSGGNNLLDIYLEDSGVEGLYGYCTTDDPKVEDPFAEGYDVSAYCGLDNDFDPSQFGGADALDSLRVTVAHEYFHAVQYAYDFLEDGWFMEATAAWVEDELFDDVNDNRQYLFSSPLTNPSRSLDQYGGSYHYGAWIFFRFLSERFSHRSGELATIVRDIWEYADGSVGGPDLFSTTAINKALVDRGTSIRTEFARFSVANRSARSFYSEGTSNQYPIAPATAVKVKPSSRNPGTIARTLDHLESSTIRYVPSSLTARDWKLRLDLDLANKSKGSMAVVKTFRRNGTTSSKYVTLNTKGDARVRVDFSSSTVKAVEVTLVNSSPRFGYCWQQASPFSCSGYSLDDNLRQTVNPIAYRS